MVRCTVSNQPIKAFSESDAHPLLMSSGAPVGETGYRLAAGVLPWLPLHHFAARCTGLHAALSMHGVVLSSPIPLRVPLHVVLRPYLLGFCQGYVTYTRRERTLPRFTDAFLYLPWRLHSQSGFCISPR